MPEIDEPTGDNETVTPDTGPQPPEPDWQDKFTGQCKVNRDLELKLRAAQAEVEQLLKPKPTDDVLDVEAIRAEAQRDAALAAAGRILRSEIKAAAAGKLADPADAARFIDTSAFIPDADGGFDETQVAEAISDLIRDKPYLAAQGGRVLGAGDGGARQSPPPDLDAQSRPPLRRVISIR